MHIQKRRSRILHVVTWICIAGGTLLIAIACVIQWEQLQRSLITNQPQESTLPTNSEADIPPSIEKPKPSEFDNYTVSLDLPRYLFIPKLSVKAMIKPVGITKDNRIDAPKNAFDAGWYSGSSKPGKDGAVLIDGHVSGGSVPGIFSNLKELQIGDSITIERGDSTQLNYKVLSKKEYDVNNVDMKAVLSSASSRPGLNLITCTGNVMRGSNNYDKRLVVFTEQL